MGNFRIGNGIDDLADFLLGKEGGSTVACLVAWEGFDLPLDRDSIMQLTLQEARAIVDVAMEAVRNPPAVTSEIS